MELKEAYESYLIEKKVIGEIQEQTYIWINEKISEGISEAKRDGQSSVSITLKSDAMTALDVNGRMLKYVIPKLVQDGYTVEIDSNSIERRVPYQISWNI